MAGRQHRQGPGADTEQPAVDEPARRDSDRLGPARTHEVDLEWAARRAAVSIAAATLQACDGGTGSHCDDVVHLCDAIADILGVHGDERFELLAAAQLHDIGKVGIPHEVLHKPGALDEREWALVRDHTIVGERIVCAAPELGGVARLVRHSHERWDGGGYPDGLAGDEIPLASRIVFCADAFHAIRSDRPYRLGRSPQDALDEVRRGSGSQFDPAVVDALAGAAEQLCVTVGAGGKGLPATLRSRRLVALLVAITVSGSATAAAGTFYAQRDDSPPSAGRSFPRSIPAPVTAVPTSATPASRTARPAGARRRKARTSVARRPTSAGAAARAAQRATPLAAAARSSAQRPATASPSVAPSPRRGRSELAPRRPAQPGKPVGGAPGRSEEAPGRRTAPVAPPPAAGRGGAGAAHGRAGHTRGAAHRTTGRYGAGAPASAPVARRAAYRWIARSEATERTSADAA